METSRAKWMRDGDPLHPLAMANLRKCTKFGEDGFREGGKDNPVAVVGMPSSPASTYRFNQGTNTVIEGMPDLDVA